MVCGRAALLQAECGAQPLSAHASGGALIGGEAVQKFDQLALGDCGVRPTKAEWSRFLSACDLVRSVDAESA